MPDTPKPGVPDFGAVTANSLRTALARGWTDFKRAPVYALVFAGVYVVMGWIMYWVTSATGQIYWLVFAAIGFPLIAPYAAVAFYDVSRRLERGDPLDWAATMGVIVHQSRRQLPSMGAVIVVVFLIWFFLAHMIFALFLGLTTMTNVSSSYEVYFTGNGLMMLAFGSVVGALFATLLYMITVLSLPMLLDREVDFMTAMITSFQYVMEHPATMFAWAFFIAAVTFISMLPGFFGLLVSLPVLGHATWHLYDILAYGVEGSAEVAV